MASNPPPPLVTKANNAPPTLRRRIITMKAQIWRFLISLGIRINHLPSPRPPHAHLRLTIPSRLSAIPGQIPILLYLPSTYHTTAPGTTTFPLILNFHGGGFTIGTAADDARWAQAVVEPTQAIFASVDYRLAPEHPFSCGVEDCADALLFLAAHAEELRIDPHRIVLTGFSAGGNFVLTVPLLLRELRLGRRGWRRDGDGDGGGIGSGGDKSEGSGKRKRNSAQGVSESSQNLLDDVDGSNSSENVNANISSNTADQPHSHAHALASPKINASLLEDLTITPHPHHHLSPTPLELSSTLLPEYTILTLQAFYPPTDFRIPRASKTRTHPRPDKNIPSILTHLFDAAYLRDPDTGEPIDKSDTLLSPAAAGWEVLVDAYPSVVGLWLAEWDMLCREGWEFGEVLLRGGGGGVEEEVEAGKEKRIEVLGGIIEGVPHGFDRMPNPVRFSERAVEAYEEVVGEMRRVFLKSSSSGGEVEVEVDIKRASGIRRFGEDKTGGGGEEGKVDRDGDGNEDRDASEVGVSENTAGGDGIGVSSGVSCGGGHGGRRRGEGRS